MVRWLQGCLALAATLIVSATALGQERFALVVGAAGYGQSDQARGFIEDGSVAWAPLANPGNDAEDVAEALRSIGFDDVQLVLDPDRATLNAATRELQSKLRAAGDDAIALFYFAGHGAQAFIPERGDTENYLIPLNTRIDSEIDLEVEALALRTILARLRPRTGEDGPGQTLIAIIDACRNNALAGLGERGAGAARGLAETTAAIGSLVAYATRPGRTASDGAGDNSPYTEALVAELVAPDRRLVDVFDAVRFRVAEATGGTQLPWESRAIVRPIVLNPLGVSPAPAPPPRTTPDDASASDGGAVDPMVDPANPFDDDPMELASRGTPGGGDAYQTYCERQSGGDAAGAYCACVSHELRDVLGPEGFTLLNLASARTPDGARVYNMDDAEQLEELAGVTFSQVMTDVTGEYERISTLCEPLKPSSTSGGAAASGSPSSSVDGAYTEFCVRQRGEANRAFCGCGEREMQAQLSSAHFGYLLATSAASAPGMPTLDAAARERMAAERGVDLSAYNSALAGLAPSLMRACGSLQR